MFENIAGFYEPRTLLLAAKSFSIIFKFFLTLVISYIGLKSKNKTTKNNALLLLIILTFSMINDLSWITNLIFHIFKSNFLIKEIVVFFIRIGNIALILKNHFFMFFIEHSVNKKIRWDFKNQILLFVTILLSMAFVYLAIFKFWDPHWDISEINKVWFGREVKITQALYIHSLILLVAAYYSALGNMRNKELPKIIAHQLKTLIYVFMLPHCIIDAFTDSVFIEPKYFPIDRRYILTISTMLITWALYYCGKKMAGLRFLNFKKHIEDHKKFNFTEDFNEILKQLSQVSSFQELTSITQTFFKSAFDIPISKTYFHLRNNENRKLIDKIDRSSKVENFLENTNFQDFRIMIFEEIEYNQFYSNNDKFLHSLKFMESIEADIFLPIYEKDKINSYIIIDRHARPGKFFSKVERDEMIVYASYISTLVNILSYTNLNNLLKKSKALEDELYLKHQEVNQYKESIKSFIRNAKDRKIGLIFCKNKKFSIANQAAQEILGYGINISHDSGHPLVKSMHNIAKTVYEYKTQQSCIAKDEDGCRVVISGLPSTDNQTIIIMIYYPEISDIIQEQINILKDPSMWDYLLYLETTQTGQLINKLIPSSGEKLLNLKLELLSAALSRKAILLQMPEEDLLPVVEIIHNISLKTNLQVLKLSGEEKNNEIFTLIFGVNKALCLQPDSVSLLEKIGNDGTLFIQNIELLALETQEALAEFLSCGFYKKLRSDNKHFSNTRVICSTNIDLNILVAEEKFSKNLFSELRNTSITMPPLYSLTNKEIENLIDGLTQQSMSDNSLKSLVELSQRDTTKIINQKPASLNEFKKHVQQTLSNKAAKQSIVEQIEFNPSYQINDPEILMALRCGKKALKDPQIMSILWAKLKSQSKIATLLGVNRSSVKRRCEQYNLE